jgi:hypothetical protein
METITLKTYNDSFIANYAVAKLSEEGIPAFLEGDEEVVIDPGFLANRNIKLKVMDYDYEKALISLEEFENK